MTKVYKVPKSGACIMKLIMAVINFVTWNASVFVKSSNNWSTIAKAVAFCTTRKIMAIKFYDTGPWCCYLLCDNNCFGFLASNNSGLFSGLVGHAELLKTHSASWQIVFEFWEIQFCRIMKILSKQSRLPLFSTTLFCKIMATINRDQDPWGEKMKMARFCQVFGRKTARAQIWQILAGCLATELEQTKPD